MKYIQFVFRVDGLPTKFCNRSNHFKCAVVLLLFAAITRLGSFNLTSIDMNQYRYRLGDYNNYNHVSSLTSSSSSNKKKEKQPTSSSFYYSEQDLDYSLWLIDQRNRSVHHLPYLPDNENNQDGKEQKSVIVSEIYYRAMQGLGHQLLRLSSAYHLASVYKIPKIQITHNPYCGGTIYTIYDYLIGEGPVFVDIPPGQGNNVFLPNNRTFLDSLLLDGHPQKGWPKLRPLTNLRTTITGDNDNNREGKVLFLNNEVMAYGHPSGLWSHRQVIHELLANNFYNKQITDYQLYHQLMTLFETNHKQEISNIVNQTLFEHHTVFGLHIRTGNGEKGDFIAKKRGMVDMDQWVPNAIKLLCDYKEEYEEQYFQTKPLMIYVGTDTGSVIPKLQAASANSCQIPFVSAQQAYPEEGQSVSFSYKYGKNYDQCLTSWKDQFLDMYMFTHCNTIIGAAYSSFTQAAPLSFVFQKAASAQRRNRRKEEQNQSANNTTQQPKYHHPHYFCGMGIDGRRIDCYDDWKAWIQQDNAKEHAFGDLNAPKQRSRHELPFPSKSSSTELETAFRKEDILLNQ